MFFLLKTLTESSGKHPPEPFSPEKKAKIKREEKTVKKDSVIVHSCIIIQSEGHGVNCFYLAGQEKTSELILQRHHHHSC